MSRCVPGAENTMDITSRLKIQDISLWETHLKRHVEYPQIEDASQLRYQTMRGVRIDQFGAGSEDGSEMDLLKMLVSLGIRCVGEGVPDADGNTGVIFTLEAVFAADYLVLDALDESEVAEFARFNAIHNVWPFWRQHVYDTLKRASLPVPEIPFFAGRSELIDPDSPESTQ